MKKKTILTITALLTLGLITFLLTVTYLQSPMHAQLKSDTLQYDKVDTTLNVDSIKLPNLNRDLTWKSK